MRALPLLLAALLLLPLAPAPPVAAPGGGPYNGLDAWDPGMGYWAPITRAFAFVEGKGVLFHSLDPLLFPTDDHIARIYQFPTCPGLSPVLGDDTPDRDSPMRRIIDIVLAECVQPESEAAIFGIGVLYQVNRQMFVNAPVVPEPYASWPDAQLYNGPPYRPRVDAWSEGAPVRFITYDVSWKWPWAGSGFPGHNVDLFMLSGDAVFAPGETLFSLFNGAAADVRMPTVDPGNVLNPVNPTPGTHAKYSPVWRATCIVPEADPTCGALRGPAFDQCTHIASCTTQPGVLLQVPADFEFVNCPVVNTDLDGDGYLSELEEFDFPDLWVDGPVLV